MKYLLPIVLLFSLFAEAQSFCTDSSTHFRYQTALNDSIRIFKTIITKDSSKVTIGRFMNGTTTGNAFVSRINARGEVAWFRRIASPFLDVHAELQCLEEASNGNLFLTFNTVQSDNKPFFYLVLSPSGTLIHQSKFGIANNAADLGNAKIYTSLVKQFGPDSVLMVLTHPASATSADGITVMTVSNSGQAGQAYTFIPPPVTSYSSYYSNYRMEGDILYLYGGAQFSNNCSINFFEQPTYTLFAVNWRTKQVVSKKIFCSPSPGYDPWGNLLSEGTDNRNTRVFMLANGQVAFTRQIWGLDRTATDALTRLFKISIFDKDLNHIRSEYISTHKKFSSNDEWDYDLAIDSLNNRYVSVYDITNKTGYYAISRSGNPFILQKQFSLPATRKNNVDGYSGILEPGYETSFHINTSDNQRSYLHIFRILSRDTAASCFGTNLDFLSYQPASVWPITWPGSFNVRIADIETTSASFVFQDYPFERTLVCNIVKRCDTLKLHAPRTVCDLSQPVRITAHKNPLCPGPVNFTFDTSAVATYSQPDDTTLVLTFVKGWNGKILASPSSCSVLKDSGAISVIQPMPDFNLGPDVQYCKGQAYNLKAPEGFSRYEWQDGSTGSAFTAQQPGKYFVTLYDVCNRIYSDTITIKSNDFSITASKDTVICISEKITLSASEGFNDYTWSPSYNISNPSGRMVSVFPEVTTSYSVSAEAFAGCILRDTVVVTVKDCPRQFFIPSAFTPNRDGKNEIFKPVITGAVSAYEFSIYSRWGQRIFHTKDRYQGWHGQVSDREQSGNVFVWVCRYQFANQKPKMEKGTVVLIK
jgi:gliding motility-associated-like protein